VAKALNFPDRIYKTSDDLFPRAGTIQQVPFLYREEHTDLLNAIAINGIVCHGGYRLNQDYTVYKILNTYIKLRNKYE
jgi:hypothetical protein